MQKTIKYQLNESYAEGFNDAREEIIKHLTTTYNTMNMPMYFLWTRDILVKSIEGMNN